MKIRKPLAVALYVANMSQMAWAKEPADTKSEANSEQVKSEQLPSVEVERSRKAWKKRRSFPVPLR